MLELTEYDISKETGFLCDFDIETIALPEMLQTAAALAKSLPDLLPSGRVRNLLVDGLHDLDVMSEIKECDDHQARIAMVHYSFMVQAYIWGESTITDRLPSCLAMPIVELADRLGQQPLLPYSGYVLDNWGKINKSLPIGLDNIYMNQKFLGGQDEAWFVLIHVAIEAKAGSVLELMPAIVEASANEDIASVTNHLEKSATIWGDINKIFDRMPERCDPYIYFERVRPYIHGWRDNPALPNGIIYEGVERYGSKGKAFRGQTGSQSSIVPAMDALMGVGHAMDPLREFLDQLHIYRPTKHRAFIDDLRRESTLRTLAERTGKSGLVDAYNANVQSVADFRSRHLEYAASYIHKQHRGSSGNLTDVGTGGTPFMKYLKKHRDETQQRLIAA